jgi:peptide/nickel transport system ATP-binding protein
MNSLNPVIRIRRQFADGLNSHGEPVTADEAHQRLADLLVRVGLDPSVADVYPHQLSGGMKQRVCIALAMSLRPHLVIADEPTSALDVVVQRQVVDTLRQVQEEFNTAVLLIGHDMGLMAQFATRVGVMYAGKLVEQGPVRQIFRQPQHPYTRILMESLPSLDQKEPLQKVKGAPPSAANRPSGCVFHPRCPDVMERCVLEPPVYREVAPDQWAACHLQDEDILYQGLSDADANVGDADANVRSQTGGVR